MNKIIFLIVLIFFAAGCGNSQIKQVATETSVNNQSGINTPKSKDDTIVSIKPDSSTTNSVGTTALNHPQEIFYGQWVIKKLLAYGPVGTYSSDDIKNMLGRRLFFSTDKASCFGDQQKYLNDVVINPIYKKTVISKIDFAKDYRNRLTLDGLGVKGNYIIEISVSDLKGHGCYFYIKDDNTLILFGGGVFLELDRENIASNNSLE